MNYYNEIKNKIIDNEVYAKVKDYSKEIHKVITYFEIGKLLNEAGGKYGDNIIKDYSNKLMIEFGKKYNERTLRRIRQYYRMFSNEKWSPVATKLSWSHYSELLSIKDENELAYYINISLNKNLSKRGLREIIKNKEYNRLPIETKTKLINNDILEVEDLVPNPILIRNKNNADISLFISFVFVIKVLIGTDGTPTSRGRFEPINIAGLQTVYFISLIANRHRWDLPRTAAGLQTCIFYFINC
jgi:hypothetical protein